MERETKISAASEEWRPVKGYEGLYEVSNLGRVRSLDKYRKFFDFNGNEYSLLVKGRVRKLQLATNGYYTVSLKIAGRGESRKLVHRLVAEAFIPNPNNLPCINHIDQNRTNNLPFNLEWCTYEYNNNYKDTQDKHRRKVQKKIEQLTMDGQHVAFFDSARDAERKSGGKYEHSFIWSAISKPNRTAYGYQWRYV